MPKDSYDPRQDSRYTNTGKSSTASALKWVAIALLVLLVIYVGFFFVVGKGIFNFIFG